MNLLSLDFDGVLHSAHDAIHLAGLAGKPMWQVELALRSQGRFAWAPCLEQCLAGSDVSIVIHSTWRRRFADVELRQLVGLDLAKRVICLDGAIESREGGTADEYLRDVLDHLRPDSLLVLDDRPQFFAQGHVQAWLDSHDGEFLWMDPDVGVSSEMAQCSISTWAHAEGCRDALVHGEAGMRPVS